MIPLVELQCRVYYEVSVLFSWHEKRDFLAPTAVRTLMFSSVAEEYPPDCRDSRYVGA